jgi:hypothetical protein
MNVRHLFAPLVALGLLILAGCEQTQTVLSINPDGTGKLQYTATFPLDIEMPGNVEMSGSGHSKAKTDDQKVADALKNVLGKSAGVDAWSGVSCTATPDGLILFKGTAYFRDLAKIKIGPLSGGGSGGSVRLEYQKTDKGYRIAVLHDESQKIKVEPSAKDSKPKTQETLQQSIRRARTGWKYTRPLLSVMIGNDVHSYTIVAPKPAKSVQGFTQTKDGYSFTFDGGKLLKAMDDLFAKSDVELTALAGQVELKDSEALMDYFSKQFGFDPLHGPAVEIESATPLFDYAKEVAAAKTSFAALCVKAGIGAPDASEEGVSAAAAPAGNRTVKSVRVKSVDRSFPENEDDNENTTVNLSVAFDGAVTSIGKVEITKLTDASGKAVADKDLSCNGNLSQNKTSGSISCALPSDLADIGRMAGTLTYTVGSGSKIVDLGAIEIKKGAKGAALEAEVEKAEGGWLNLKFKGDPDMVKAVHVLTPDGKPYKVTDFQLNGWQGYCTKTLRPAEGDQWPEKLQFKVELFTTSKPFTVPWSVQDITLPRAGK